MRYARLLVELVVSQVIIWGAFVASPFDLNDTLGLVVFGGVVVVSILAAVWMYWRHRKRNAALLEFERKLKKLRHMSFL